MCRSGRGFPQTLTGFQQVMHTISTMPDRTLEGPPVQIPFPGHTGASPVPETPLLSQRRALKLLRIALADMKRGWRAREVLDFFDRGKRCGRN